MDKSTDDTSATTNPPSFIGPMDNAHDLETPEHTRAPLWPMLLLSTALVALAVGGWATFTERRTLKAEITELNAETASLRAVAAESRSEGAELEALRDEVSGLRADLAEARRRYAALSHQLSAKEPESESIAPTRDASSSETSVHTSREQARPSSPLNHTTQFVGHSGDGPWFVNISSYSNREFARDWQQRVATVTRHVKLSQADVNGATMLRLRVNGFDSRDAAIDAARQLEASLGLGPLWVGRRSAQADEIPDSTTTQGDETPLAPRAQASQAPTPSAVETAAPRATQPLPSPPRPAGWYIHIKTFNQGGPAQELANELKDAGHDARVSVESRDDRLWYRVLVIGPGDPFDEPRLLRELAVLSGVANLQLRRYRSAP